MKQSQCSVLFLIAAVLPGVHDASAQVINATMQNASPRGTTGSQRASGRSETDCERTGSAAHRCSANGIQPSKIQPVCAPYHYPAPNAVCQIILHSCGP